MTADLTEPRQLCDLLNAFFVHTEPAHEDFNNAVDEFKQRVSDLSNFPRPLFPKLDNTEFKTKIDIRK